MQNDKKENKQGVTKEFEVNAQTRKRGENRAPQQMATESKNTPKTPKK